MSIEIQKQIKDNANDVQEYRKDLLRWTDEIGKKEERRERKRAGRPPASSEVVSSADTAKVTKASDEELLVQAAISAANNAAGVKEKPKKQEEEESQDPIKRDGQSMHKYYGSWDQFDVDGELEQLEEQALNQQKAEADVRQAEKDKILDEIEWSTDGDRKRTSKAKPRVKIAVRTTGRRASPVDLATPKKEEANRYFAEGRFREACATYTAALDLLEKYEPPEPQASSGDTGDRAGVETEALAIKTACLANRALALLKLEEWREAAVDCTEALRFDPLHAKATARRGLAYARLKIWAKATKDLTQAVEWDPSDKKAAAELKMVTRKLGEQNQEARAHAKALMCDPTRDAVMPTRRLNTTVQTAATASREAREQAEKQQPQPAQRSADSGATAGAEASAASGEFNPPVRKPYVPRSVRVRGLQPSAVQAAAAKAEQAQKGGSTPSTEGSSRASAAMPSVMNFYTFEAQWTRCRNRPHERLALLRKIGSGHLPALLRESLDADLVSSIVEVFKSELGSGDHVDFAADVLLALARTNRFDVSLRGLSQSERRLCEEVIETIGGHGSCSESMLEELREAYRPPPVEKPPSEDYESDDEPWVPPTTAAASAPQEVGDIPVGTAAAADEEEEEASAPPEKASVQPEAAPAPPVVEAQGFSLDDCD